LSLLTRHPLTRTLTPDLEALRPDLDAAHTEGQRLIWNQYDTDAAVKLIDRVLDGIADGNLGGLAGADAHCQRLASDAGLPGAYRAWLSDSRDSPSTRFTRSTGPYVLANGTVIADRYADFTDGTLDNAIARTERDEDPPESTGNDCNKVNSPTAVWSGSAANGGGIPVGAGQRCQDWTSAEGNGQMGDAARFDEPAWSTACSSVCTARAPLYCIQQ
jgi:hypothetical protein